MLVGASVCWLVGWLARGFAGSSGSLVDAMVRRLFVWFVGSSIGSLGGWLVACFPGFLLACWLVRWLIGRLVGRLVGWLVGGLAGWLIGWLVGR